jgi:hypothetical protein
MKKFGVLAVLVEILFFAAQFAGIVILVNMYCLGHEYTVRMAFKWLGIGVVLAVIIRYTIIFIRS